MHGNAPHDGPNAEYTAEDLRALRRDVASVTARTRALLPDEFVVGSELREGTDGPQGTVAVQPPVGNVVTSGVAPDGSDQDHSDLAHDLAAGAALQVKRAVDGVEGTAG
jgi:hypothetical protein